MRDDKRGSASHTRNGVQQLRFLVGCETYKKPVNQSVIRQHSMSESHHDDSIYAPGVWLLEKRIQSSMSHRHSLP